jgi:hypothetical protein
MIRIGRKAIIAGATALVLAAGSSIATAAVLASSGPVDSSGVIHGCWTNAELNGSHVFVLQDAGTTCPKGTTAISWNQTGPSGSPGPSGPPGPPGTSAAVDIGTVTFTQATNAGPGGCTLTNLSGPSASNLTAALDYNTQNVTGCLISGFDSSTPIVFATNTQFLTGTVQYPTEFSIALEAGQGPGSVLIGYDSFIANPNVAQWNFEAYPNN